MPKFRPHRVSTRQPTRRQQTLDETAEESPEHENPDVELKRASAPPVSQTPEKTDDDTSPSSPDECVVLLPKEPSESKDGDNLIRGYSEKSRGKLKRQDESVV